MHVAITPSTIGHAAVSRPPSASTARHPGSRFTPRRYPFVRRRRGCRMVASTAGQPASSRRGLCWLSTRRIARTVPVAGWRLAPRACPRRVHDAGNYLRRLSGKPRGSLRPLRRACPARDSRATMHQLLPKHALLLHPVRGACLSRLDGPPVRRLRKPAFRSLLSVRTAGAVMCRSAMGTSLPVRLAAHRQQHAVSRQPPPHIKELYPRRTACVACQQPPDNSELRDSPRRAPVGATTKVVGSVSRKPVAEEPCCSPTDRRPAAGRHQRVDGLRLLWCNTAKGSNS